MPPPNLPPDFEEQHDQRLNRVIAALIDSLPVGWDEGILEMSVPEVYTGQPLVHAIRHPAARQERVRLADDLFSSTVDLWEYAQTCRPWTWAAIYVWRTGCDWDFKAEFGDMTKPAAG